ncbi:hypothetical protein pdam_00002474 [Pocillopora damicornis]|uniref:RING-type domain-containing protein n=1 Tax=Pocillopora damicornis TaxID=46731 RepID=A0A3M6TSA4_POCDA|nr:hypothetical protein pdam_00002474 [Pocillopora damicornis]
MAADSTSFFDDVKKRLECCIYHTFCKSCLEDGLHPQARGKLSCPTCRQIIECPDKDVNSLPSDLFKSRWFKLLRPTAEMGKETCHTAEAVMKESRLIFNARIAITSCVKTALRHTKN